ncbi:NUDIX hydrolase [Limnochorda pilosa]|uniref:NUDIX hydrolase n=1 Tax=Limnochorda pilosa TaxID=1555112 RepID=A0A0K2SNM6_LIMPI|nr:NUDIX domain-containing protein [Limnochorda pilosa]BAS28733.1 NUDIX hydrolase [Limnochorda pilosa]
MASKPPNRTIRCRDVHGGEREFPAGDLRFRPAAYGIALDGQGRVLLGRSAFHGRWELPGGAVEPWETLEEGLAREFAEETGLHAAVEERIGFDDGFIAFFRYPFHSLRFFYRVAVDPLAPMAPQAGEITALQWRPVAELGEDEVAYGHLPFIRCVADGQVGSGL